MLRRADFGRSCERPFVRAAFLSCLNVPRRMAQSVTSIERSPGLESVLALENLTPTCDGQVGSKALTLARLRQAGLPVPCGFCVTTAAYQRWIGAVPNAGDTLDRLDEVAAGNPDRLAALAAEWRDRLDRLAIPTSTEAAILSARDRWAGVVSWAVRSSATTEDRSDASFAGQHDSFLDVEPAAVVAAVRRCWTTLFTERAMLYRVRRQIRSREAAMAVLVQEMIPAEVAGVLFSADPVRRDRTRILIEAVQGCGAALVSGRVAPERVVVDRASRRVVERLASPGPVKPTPAPEAGQSLAVPESQRLVVLVDDRMAARLCRLAMDVERRLGAPQDLEWAALNGTLHLLQARPITTGLGRAASVPPEVWCNANMCENLPGVLTPMSWSLVELLLVGCFRRIMAFIGIDTEVRPWFGLIAGRLYLNVGLSDELLRRVQVSRQVDVWRLLGGTPTAAEQAALEAARKPARLSVRHSLWLAGLGLRAILRLGDAWGAAFVALVRKRVDDLCQTDFAALSDAELASAIPGSIARLFPEVDDPPALVRVLVGFSPGLACAALLRVACRRWVRDSDGAIAQRLLGGAGDMDSASPAIDLWRLAVTARTVPELSSVLLTAPDFAGARARLSSTPAGTAFLEQWDSFMRRHGHHARGEVDVFSPRWAEMPDEVLEMIRHYWSVADGFDAMGNLARRSEERERLWTDLRKRLRNPFKRRVLSCLVRRAQRGLAYRENIKSQAVRAIAAMRAALLESGRRLSARGVSGDVQDVFFLRIEELERALRGQSQESYRGIISQRRLDWRELQQLNPPSIVVGEYHPVEPEEPFQPSHGAVVLRGLGVSAGLIRGKARVVAADDTATRLLPGEILVAPWTDPGWAPLFFPAAGIVTDIGGELSHGSIVAREYGIPAVVNLGDATRRIRTGQLLEVDGTRGLVRVLSDADAAAPTDEVGDPAR